MAASNYYLKRYFPKTDEVVLTSLRRGGFNLTENSFSKGNILIDLSIRFGY